MVRDAWRQASPLVSWRASCESTWPSWSVGLSNWDRRDGGQNAGTDAGYPRCRRPSPKDLNSPIFLWTRRGLLIFCSGWHLFHVRACGSSPRQRCFGASFTYDNERCPGCRVGMCSVGSDHHDHGTPQRFGATDGRVGPQSGNRVGDKFNCRIRLYRPARDKQGTSTGVEECACQT